MNKMNLILRSTSQPSNSTMKPSHTTRNVGIIAIVIIVVLIVGISAAMIAGSNDNSGYNSGATSSGPTYVTQTVTIFSGSAAVNPGSYYAISFSVPSNAINVQLSGSLTASGGSGNDVRVYVMDSTNYINWQNGHSASAYYTTGQETAFNINVGLPDGAGTYYVVFDNTFSIISSKTVTGTITLTYEVPSS
ncbi:MAG: emp24/gp25L/p24 family protein [Caldisphaera sp.]